MKLCKPTSITLPIVCAIYVCILTSCGSSDSVDGTLLIDEMSQIDFDIDYPVGQITQGVEVSQDFISITDTITQIWLYGATYMRDNTATIEVKLSIADDTVTGENSATTDEAGVTSTDVNGDSEDSDILASWTINSAEMEDNTIIKLDVPASEANTGLTGAHLVIDISSPDGEPDLSPTFWMTEEDVYPDGHLSISGYEQYNDLWFQVVGD